MARGARSSEAHVEHSPVLRPSCRRLERMMSDSETISWDGNLMFPDQVADVVLQSMGTNLGKSPAIRLLRSSSCGDIFRFCSARHARSQCEAIWQLERRRRDHFPPQNRQPFAFVIGLGTALVCPSAVTVSGLC